MMYNYYCASTISYFFFFFFFFNDTATTEIYTLSLHDALPISSGAQGCSAQLDTHIFDYIQTIRPRRFTVVDEERQTRSEEHTSELQSQSNLVCRLLLEKKKKKTTIKIITHK